MFEPPWSSLALLFPGHPWFIEYEDEHRYAEDEDDSASYDSATPTLRGMPLSRCHSIPEGRGPQNTQKEVIEGGEWRAHKMVSLLCSMLRTIAGLRRQGGQATCRRRGSQGKRHPLRE